MTALALRDALGPLSTVERRRALTRDTVIADYVRRYGAIPATSRSADEPVVRYSVVDSGLPILMGAYGDPGKVRSWLPGLPARATPAWAAKLVGAACSPVTVTDPACQARQTRPDLKALPVPQATPRDAGPYLTTGLVFAQDPVTGEQALSAHRMLVLDRSRLTIWMVPGRQLRAMHLTALKRRRRLAVSVNIGAPPAAMIASALNTRFLPPGVSKLDLAGALADAPVALAPALTQPTSVLADSEIVLEGYLGSQTHDETLSTLDGSLPEFLGYDGGAQPALPVLHVTAQTTRPDPFFHALAGPGREQSVILGLAGALSVALSGLDCGSWDHLVSDLHFSLAGGGMTLLVVSVRKSASTDDHALGPIADRILRQHPFVKLVVFVDDDIDPACPEDLWWAVMTRANLTSDCHSLTGFAPLGMDASQRPQWAAEKAQRHPQDRAWIDATAPFRLRRQVTRSFAY